MSWLTNTVLPGNKAFRARLLYMLALLLTRVAATQEASIHAPQVVTAGADFTISTEGNGKALFYLVGPGNARKEEIELGRKIHISSAEALNAGRYVAVVCTETCQSTSLYVVAANAANLAFLVHPSRVPVQEESAISGTIFALDQFHNLVLSPVPVSVEFHSGSDSLSRSLIAKDGVAWLRMKSGKVAGPAELMASTANVHVRRVVRQVASEPCSLRIRARRSASGVMVETEPVRDCAGNRVPDGTIVTFTKTDNSGKSTLDVPVKQGIARAWMGASPHATISAASGIMLGNPVRVGE